MQLVQCRTLHIMGKANEKDCIESHGKNQRAFQSGCRDIVFVILQYLSGGCYTMLTAMADESRWTSKTVSALEKYIANPGLYHQERIKMAPSLLLFSSLFFVFLSSLTWKAPQWSPVQELKLKPHLSEH